MSRRSRWVPLIAALVWVVLRAGILSAEEEASQREREPFPVLTPEPSSVTFETESAYMVPILPAIQMDSELSGMHLDSLVELRLASLSLEEKVGQLLMLDLYAPGGSLPLTVDQRVRELLARYRPGGIVLYAANMRSIGQTVDLIRQLQNASRVPLLIAVDEEGGIVSRLSRSEALHATKLPAGRTVGLAASDELAYQIGRVMGRELRSLGINMNLAPVADILSDPFSSIGTRSYGSDPELVSRMTASVVRGIQDQGVSAVLKHFPGHGATADDSHDGVVVIQHDQTRLESFELRPFEAGIAAEVDGVMTAHIVFPNVTEDGLPVSFSPYFLKEILRKRLGHQNLIITDSLVMSAIGDHWGPGDSAIAAIRAGVDVILRPMDVELAYSAILWAVRDGEIPMERIDDSVRRILRVKHRRSDFDSTPATEDPEQVLGHPDHQKVVNQIYRAVEAKRP